MGEHPRPRPVPGPGNGCARCATPERDTAISQLADAYADGRIGRTEHDRRETGALTADLPGPGGPVLPGRAPRSLAE